jgi:hypothetical protein
MQQLVAPAAASSQRCQHDLRSASTTAPGMCTLQPEQCQDFGHAVLHLSSADAAAAALCALILKMVVCSGLEYTQCARIFKSSNELICLAVLQ